VHPDKNEGNPHAKKAFELLNKAYKTLQDPSEVAFVRQVIEEATKRVDDDLKIKKKEYKRRIGRKKGSGKVEYPREIVLKGKDPDRYEALIQYMTCKVFVELDDRRRRAIDLEVANKKRKREEDQEKVEKMKQEAEFQKKWEEGREERVSSWREHQKGTLLFSVSHHQLSNTLPPYNSWPWCQEKWSSYKTQANNNAATTQAKDGDKELV